MLKKSRNGEMKKLLNKAKEHLVGGVNSPVRSFNYVGGDPILIKKGKGSKFYDLKGKEYIDYVLSFGALMLGHAHPEVVKDSQKALSRGLNFGVTTSVEIELAELIKTAVKGIEKIRFVNSGTEAVMGAVRLARGYTGREKIVKFENSYHGHADYLLAKSGSGLASLGIPFSKGVPKDFTKHTIISKYGDKEDIDRVFRRYKGKIAAVIVEPAGGNYGVIPPDKDFLMHLREVTKKYGSLLIFDEVITGFRASYGTLGDKLGIKPDLVCLGKIIGGGLPVGAYGGGKKIMDNLAPLGEVYQASTFAGNPVVMQAGLTSLKNIYKQRGKYKVLVKRVQDLSETVQREAEKNNIDLKVSYYGTMFSFKFGNKDLFKKFFWELILKGIFIAPSEFEANFVSFANTEKDFENTKKIIGNILRNL